MASVAHHIFMIFFGQEKIPIEDGGEYRKLAHKALWTSLQNMSNKK